jgi:integrase
MPRHIDPLTVKQLDALKPPAGTQSAMQAVGGASGLHIKINPAGGRSWILRARVGGKRREFGLGPYPSVSLKDAREKAHEMRGVIEQGIDPLQERKRTAAREALDLSRKKTFAQVVVEFVAAGQLGHIRSEKHQKQWVADLERLANPIIGDFPIADLTHEDMLRVLTQTHANTRTKQTGDLWIVAHPSAQKIKQSLSKVMVWATSKSYRKGDNPCGPLLDILLPKHRHIEVPHPALQMDDCSRWYAALSRCEGMGHRALEFLALTAARSGEVRGARWDEVDFDKGIWTVSADRMKMSRKHRVALSGPAIALLHSLPRRLHGDLVFFASRGGQLSDMTLSANMADMDARDEQGFVDAKSGRPATPHGMRSTFKDWATERTEYDNSLSEIALAHNVGSDVERAYRRGDMLEKRRRMMEDWATHLEGGQNVAALNVKV